MRTGPSPPHRALALAALLCIASLGVLAAPAAAQEEPAVKLMVLGETHGTRTVTQSLVKLAASKGAVGCVCPGDFIYGHWSTTPGAWRDMMRPFMGQMLPAQGNHDWPWSDWSGMFPDGRSYYSKDVNGAQFISVNTEYSLASGSTQRAWLEARLAERDPSAAKVVFMHRPWWLPSGAIHPSSEFEAKNGASASTMDALMERHGVDLVVSAHEKNYQHSIRGGVHYLVAGGGGHEFTSMGYSLPGAVKRVQGSVVSTLDVTASGMTLKSYDAHGVKIEEFTMGATASAPAPAPTTSSTAPALAFTPSAGNEWWAQVSLSGADAGRVAKVEAKDATTPWTALTLRSWGAWAGSFHIEPGNTVTYRATLTDGRVATSCAYAHPTGGCSAGATGAASVTFAPSSGNEWWVQVGLSGADAARVTRVEAMDATTPWTALTLRSWGAWAGSFRVEPGNTVTYRATLDDGRVATSCAYAHPAATCAAAAAPGVTFTLQGGNEWWVQAKVQGATPTRVEVRDTGGAYAPLTLRSWGDWAASYHVEPGHQVQLRATLADGRLVESAWLAFPG